MIGPLSGTESLELDEATGWPLEPKYPCYKAVVSAKGAEPAMGEDPSGKRWNICHLRLSDGPGECIYEPKDCPFYGRYPRL